MSQETQTQTLDESLAKTDLGATISEYKKPILVIFTLIIVAIVIYSVVNHNSSQSRIENLNKVFEAQSILAKPLLESQVYNDELFNNFLNISNEVFGQSAFMPTVIEASNKLIELKKEGKALELLEKALKFTKKSSYFYFFIGLRVAPLHENAGNNVKAIEVYEAIKEGKKGIMDSMIYLNLGRLYAAEQNSEQAKSNFDFVIKLDENSDDAKIAKALLGRL